MTDRLPRSEMRGGSGTAAVRVWFDDTPPSGMLPVQAGSYRIRLESLAGVTVDTARFMTDRGRAIAITETVATRGSLSWDVTPRPPRDGEAAVTIGIALENRGRFLSPADVTLAIPGDNRTTRMRFLAPGERVRVAFALSKETVRRIRARGNGVVRLYVNDDAGTGSAGNATVRLPPPE